MRTSKAWICGVLVSAAGCVGDEVTVPSATMEESGVTSGDGDGDGDADTTGDGDGDADTTGDGDGDAETTGDGDGDADTAGDGDGDPGTSECGNGEIEEGEACDDGNLLNADGCNDDCAITGSEQWVAEPQGDIPLFGAAPQAAIINGAGQLVIAIAHGVSAFRLLSWDTSGEAVWDHQQGLNVGSHSLAVLGVDGLGRTLLATNVSDMGRRVELQTFDASGSQVWADTVEGPTIEAFSTDTLGRAVFVGSSNNDWWSGAYELEGQPAWTASWGTFESNDEAMALAPLEGGGVAIYGEHDPDQTLMRVALHDSEGALIHGEIQPSEVNEELSAFVHSNGRIHGVSKRRTSSADRDILIRSWNLAGTLLSTHELGGAFADRPVGTLALASGDVLHAWYSVLVEDESPVPRASLVRVDGSLGWTHTFDDLGTGRPAAVALDSAGRVVVAGYDFQEGEVWLRCLDSEGATVWTDHWSEAGSYLGIHMTLDGSENLTVVGDGESPDFHASGIWGRSYDVNGELVWTASYDTPTAEKVSFVLTHANGDVLVVGRRSSPSRYFVLSWAH